MSALGHERPLRTLSSQQLLSGAKQTFHREIDVANSSETGDARQVLSELYIQALLVDEELGLWVEQGPQPDRIGSFRTLRLAIALNLAIFVEEQPYLVTGKTPKGG